MKNFMLKFMSFSLFAMLFSTIGFSQNYSIEITFVDHLKAGMIEQDVFVEKEEGSGEVYRVTVAEREKYLDSEVYATTEMVHHDPFDASKVGPYEKGASLGFTLRDYTAATGTATCSCEDGWGSVKAEFKNLVPNGVYTMWHAFMPKGVTIPFLGTMDLPIGERDGTQSVFKADKNGNASVDVRFETCLQLSENQLMGLLAIAYHSDGKTYGIVPGPFGQGTQVQLFSPLPEADDVEISIAGNK